ncbi:hypothetical protein NLM33_47015 (plasmid) [Bradyrhizobium sp. CCGUVB1N3]|uniref:hypothetical protein n=1 Tax=Bradyrhizobium sp. CCGUVB1N3 TaxID=2949629 RepID=UPI0020B1D4B0|nr:hypothetical protein [Bradyrhizobium sp. CCGUVB1N3]MCP3477695.1 hypothetical protein [Bradyrhizobium sp. CCGUVB1N3]
MKSILANHPFAWKFMRAGRLSKIVVEADAETAAEERRRFAIINIPRHQFSQATGESARRAADSPLKRRPY